MAEPNQTPVPPPRPVTDRRGRWVAILTGALSILIGVAYLVLITVLDSRGPLLPPPPEALGVAAAAAPAAAAAVPPPG
ncbi:hypothetical protein C7B81_03585 [Aphanothece cf. minutissima CCALA 015]|uniref:Glucose-inhibited division protein A n=1 Tax=Aphanothece cf. minutissima CCALA 015 TaxID=2107695 RepID=A0ABX5FCA8_9CHRO|nr:hypothetical protein C7B81_03585 [Aphanothece cf. minutissima CCALA 015]